MAGGRKPVQGPPSPFQPKANVLRQKIDAKINQKQLARNSSRVGAKTYKGPKAR